MNVYQADNRTTLRLVLLAITGRPVVWPPTPQREYDVGLIPQDRLLGRNGKPKQTSEKPQTEKDNRRPVVNSLQRAPLRTHLYPLVTALPEEYLPSPLGLVPQIESVSELTAEVLSSTAVLVQVILIIRDAVGYCSFVSHSSTNAHISATSVLDRSPQCHAPSRHSLFLFCSNSLPAVSAHLQATRPSLPSTTPSSTAAWHPGSSCRAPCGSDGHVQRLSLLSRLWSVFLSSASRASLLLVTSRLWTITFTPLPSRSMHGMYNRICGV